MNKSVKITLLVAAILLAVGGVMAFYKTIVSPPGEVRFKNQFVTACEEDVKRAKAATTDIALDTTFTAVTHELDFMLKNGLLDGEERDRLMGTFTADYAPNYARNCEGKFNQAVWNENRLTDMQARIKEILAIKSTTGKRLIDGEAEASLQKVTTVISNYYAAKKAASASGYSGLDAARKKIAEAKRYISMSPLNNCTELMSKLRSVSSRLNQAHISYLKGQVERLRHWQSYSEEGYDNLAFEVQAKLEEYKKHASSVYGSANSVSGLESLASQYYNNSNF